MKQIDEFIHSIYENVNGKEAEELKEEMRSHLLEAVVELKSEGKTEEEAVKIAIDRFGDKRQLTIGLLDIFKVQSRAVRFLLRFTMISLVIGVGSLVALFVRDAIISNEQLSVQEQLHTTIEGLEVTALTEGDKVQIVSSLEEATNGKLEYIGLYKKPDGSPEFWRENNFPVLSEMDQMLLYGNTRNWDFGTENQHWYIEVGYDGSHALGTLYAIPYSFLIIFAVLGIVTFILRQSTQRKMLNLFLAEER